MSFDRFRAQLSCEDFLSCTGNLVAWNNSDFKNLVLSSDQASRLEAVLKEDSVDLYYKGILSLFESLSNFNSYRYSWGVIKAYYSIFYLLRSELAAKKIALIRHKSIYYLESKDGESPKIKKNKKDYATDHKATINYYIDLSSNSDKLLSQNINLEDVYSWFMKKREQICYRERYFHEPGIPDFLSKIHEEILNGFDILIDKIVKDNYILTFQEEFAPLAIPIKRVFLTKETLDRFAVNINFSNEKKEFLIALLPVYNENLQKLI